MSFPKISRKIESSQETITIQFLTENRELILNKEKCLGCGTCFRVCPKEAINRGPIGASRRATIQKFPTKEDIIPEIYNVNKCVFCGTCVYFCPVSALTIKKNGNIVNLEDIEIVKQKVVPKLEFEAKKIKDSKNIERTIKQYAKAEISVIDEQCPRGCSTCATVCPSGTIAIAKKPEHGWEFSKNVEVVDADACIACAACDNACPTGALQLKITEVKTSGDYNAIFWDDLIKRLKHLRWSNIKEA